MNETNYKRYLQQFPAVLLLALLSGALFLLLSGYDMYVGGRLSYPVYIFTHLSYDLFFFCSLGIVFKDWRAAGFSLGAQLVLCFLEILVNNYNLQTVGRSSAIINICIEVLRPVAYAMPFLVFMTVYGSLKREKVFVVLLLYWLIYKGFVCTWYTPDAVASYFNWHQEISGTNYRPAFNTRMVTATKQVLTEIIDIIFVAEVLNYLGKPKMRMNTRVINMHNDGGVTGSTVAFCTIHIFMWYMLVGVYDYFERGYIFWYSVDTALGAYYHIEWVINILCASLILMTLGWYHRKLILESFMARGIHAKIIYWFTLLPIIGIVAWLLILNGHQRQTADTVKTVEHTYTKPPLFITIITLLLQGYLLYKTSGSTMVFVVVGGGASLLFIWYSTQPPGYWFYLGTNFFLLVFALGFCLYHSWGNGEFPAGFPGRSWAQLVTLLLFGIGQLLLLLPVYHPQLFDYSSPSPTENETGSDLFADQFEAMDTDQ